ncbi:MAG: penicillin-binding transpeptidase domain-containing protein [Trueperaceae bacterium]|nr:penicillin-binding transpeptidase domain-containing protein [Trueperaceae bacterium]
MISRMRVLLAVMLTVLVVFTGRLMYLQLARAEQYSDLSRQNFTHPQRIAPLRGRLLSRDGTVLADNRVAYDLMYWGGEVRGWSRLAHLLDLEGPPRPPDAEVPSEVRNGAVVAWNIDDELVPAVEERVAGQPNLYLRERIERIYPTNLAAQTVGYTGLADPERHPGYGLDDMIGVSGLEAGLEEILYGAPGRALVEVDHRGVPLVRRELEPATPGTDVVLTLDTDAQRAAEDALEGAAQYVNEVRAENGLPRVTRTKGALLAMDVHTGDVVAMASLPTFDQNLFTHRPNDPETLADVLSDDDGKPLANRAIQAFPPASTYKLVTSYTLLERGFVGPGTRYGCSARLSFGGIIWRNWATYYRGDYTVTEAIADSCNTYYWRAAIDTPDFREGWAAFAQALQEDAQRFGYGRTIGVGLPAEHSGRVPDEDWTRQAKDTPWYPGYTLNTVIGQGDVLATPLQTLQFVGALANRGDLVQPRLVRAVGGEPRPVRTRQIPGDSWDVLAEGMRRMVTDYGASRRIGPQADFPLAVAGKTGTAEAGGPEGMEHAWFMAYAPAGDPDIAVVAFLENAGSSSATAVPVVRDFLADHYDLDWDGD